MAIPVLLMMAIIYSLEISILGIGFTLTYLTSKIPNFAHGTYAGIGIYISYTLSKIFNITPYAGLPLAFILGGTLSIFLYVTIIGVLTKMGGGTVVKTISTIAIQIFLTASLYIYAYWLTRVYKTYAFNFLLKAYDFNIGEIPGVFLVAIIISCSIIILLYYMLSRTKLGIAMRATCEDPELASILGIDTYRIQLYSWFLTGGLASIAGTLLPLWFQSNPGTGNIILSSVMAGSLFGGLDNIYSAIVGGFSVGLTEILVTNWLQNLKIGGQRLLWIGEYRPLVPLIIMIVILVIEPGGLQAIVDRLKHRRVKGS